MDLCLPSIHSASIPFSILSPTNYPAFLPYASSLKVFLFYDCSSTGSIQTIPLSGSLLSLYFSSKLSVMLCYFKCFSTWTWSFITKISVKHPCVRLDSVVEQWIEDKWGLHLPLTYTHTQMEETENQQIISGSINALKKAKEGTRAESRKAKAACYNEDLPQKRISEWRLVWYSSEINSIYLPVSKD